MPCTQERIADNSYRHPGENTHLPLRADEVAWTGGKAGMSYVWAPLAVVVALGIFVAALLSVPS